MSDPIQSHKAVKTFTVEKPDGPSSLVLPAGAEIISASAHGRDYVRLYLHAIVDQRVSETERRAFCVLRGHGELPADYKRHTASAYCAEQFVTFHVFEVEA